MNLADVVCEVPTSFAKCSNAFRVCEVILVAYLHHDQSFKAIEGMSLKQPGNMFQLGESGRS